MFLHFRPYIKNTVDVNIRNDRDFTLSLSLSLSCSCFVFFWLVFFLWPWLILKKTLEGMLYTHTHIAQHRHAQTHSWKMMMALGIGKCLGNIVCKVSPFHRKKNKMLRPLHTAANVIYKTYKKNKRRRRPSSENPLSLSLWLYVAAHDAGPP